MNKFFGKIAQVCFTTLLGYEIGEKVGEKHQDSVVVKVLDPVKTEIDHTEREYEGAIIISVVIAVLLLLIFVLYIIWRAHSTLIKRVRTTEMIGLNERRAQAPRI